MPAIGSTLALNANRCPLRSAVIFEGRTYTYRELDDAVNRLANTLAEKGLRKGERVLVISGNSDNYVVAVYAVMKLGAILVPVNPRSAQPELDYLLEDSGAVMLIFGAEVLETIRAQQAAAPSKLKFHPLALARVEGFECVIETAALASAVAPDVEVDEADDAVIIYTSGTTGRPKGALFDHHRILWVGINVVAAFDVRDRDRILHVAPMYHSAEFSMFLVCGTMIGATHVILRAFEPEVVLQTLESEKINVFFGVPTMYHFLLRSPNLAQRDLSAWRVGVFGAAPMPPSTVETLVAALPGVSIYQACGQTEGGPGGICSSPEEVRARPDASGRFAIPNTEVRIVDRAGNDVAAGSVGEMIMRGETMMKGYWKKPEETAKTVVKGWIHTGDLARIDADGYITLVDRIKDLIITGGRNVYSVEVENALSGHPNVAEVAIISRGSEEFGETVVAVVNPLPGRTVTLQELRDFGATLISDYKLPRELVISEIPRNPSGKILKHVLRANLPEK